MEDRMTGVPGSRCEQDGQFFPDPIAEQYGHAECVDAGHTITPGPEFPILALTPAEIEDAALIQSAHDKIAANAELTPDESEAMFGAPTATPREAP